MVPTELFTPRVVRDDGVTPPNVLLVDDVDANLVALESVLSSLRCNLVYARSGSEALAHLLRDEFALILMDVQMPDMDGYETARLVRARRKTRHVPIIFLTAHDCDASGIKRAYDLGAVDFLPKPLDIDVLRAKAQAFIALHERTLEVAELRVERAMLEERARQEAEALRRDMERLAASDRRKTELLAMLAGELRAPLAPLHSSFEAIRQASNDTHLVDAAERHLRQVTQLVDNLLDVTRISSGNLELSRTCIDVALLVELAITHAGAPATLTINPPADPVAVEVDAPRFVQVLANLVESAVRNTPADRVASITWGREYGHAFLKVTDHGAGTGAADLDKVFELTGGNLGLALAKQLVELHRGTITATSGGAGQGSTFEVRLAAAEFPLDAARSRLVTARQRALVRPRILRVLIVDDDEDFSEVTAALLAGRGHQVMRAFDARSALTLLAEQRPDVALVDLDLPAIDGCELLRLARTLDPPLPTRFVAMTDGSVREDERASSSGFASYLARPIVSSAIVLALEAD